MVNNDSNNTNDKIFKVRPIIDAVKNEYIRFEPEEYQAVDEKIIQCKNKRSRIRQSLPKKPKKSDFKNLVCFCSSGIICDFYTYCGKDEKDIEFEGLQKCSVALAKHSIHITIILVTSFISIIGLPHFHYFMQITFISYQRHKLF